MIQSSYLNKSDDNWASQPWNKTFFFVIKSLFVVGVHLLMANVIPDLYSVNGSHISSNIVPALRQPNISPDFTECPLEVNLLLVEIHHAIKCIYSSIEKLEIVLIVNFVFCSVYVECQ